MYKSSARWCTEIQILQIVVATLGGRCVWGLGRRQIQRAMVDVSGPGSVGGVVGDTVDGGNWLQGGVSSQNPTRWKRWCVRRYR